MKPSTSPKVIERLTCSSKYPDSGGKVANVFSLEYLDRINCIIHTVVRTIRSVLVFSL